MTNEVKLAAQNSLKPGKMQRIHINDKWILLANIDGDFFAVDAICTHEDADLSRGALKEFCVECPLHGSRFDMRNGKPQEEPADVPLQTYELVLKNEDIFIKL